MPITRRTLLRAVGVLGVAGALGGCSSQQGTPSSGPTSSPSGQPTFDPVAKVAPNATDELSLITGSFEQLVGAHPFAFGLLGPDNEPLTDARPQLWVVPTAGGEPTGPHPTTFHEVPGQPLGLYVAEVAITTAGPTAFVAVTADGRAGSDAINVATAADSQLPSPGQPATSVTTPTADVAGMATLCTADPPCGMHEVSLDTALTQSRPILVTFATPEFCHTAVCGPSVSVLDEVRTRQDWGDAVFIHVEIYSDAGETVAPQVVAWNLPSEPWLFAIDRDGAIQARADGPLLTISDQVAAIAEEVTASA